MAMMDTLPVWIALIALGMVVAVVLLANQRETTLEATEARASLAEARAATAEAAVTAQAQMQAATATALAYANSPQATVDRSLQLVLDAEREPTNERLRALNDAFAPSAMAVIRPEVEHLLSGGLHLGGQSSYDLSVLDASNPEPNSAQVRTRERWTYDERGTDDQRVRCLIETSEQTYTLQRVSAEWQVADINVTSDNRADCPS
jgi:hypothetical protein